MPPHFTGETYPGPRGFLSFLVSVERKLQGETLPRGGGGGYGLGAFGRVAVT